MEQKIITSAYIQGIFSSKSPRDAVEFADALAAIVNGAMQLEANPHFDLGDQVYGVREREGEGWNGQAVKDFGLAHTNIVNGIAALIDFSKRNELK
jgi:hypothetical protein